MKGGLLGFHMKREVLDKTRVLFPLVVRTRSVLHDGDDDHDGDHHPRSKLDLEQVEERDDKTLDEDGGSILEGGL